MGDSFQQVLLVGLIPALSCLPLELGKASPFAFSTFRKTIAVVDRDGLHPSTQCFFVSQRAELFADFERNVLLNFIEITAAKATRIGRRPYEIPKVKIDFTVIEFQAEVDFYDVILSKS
jgi:hypothetical protein